MKTLTEKFTITVDKKTGADIVSVTGNKLALTDTGVNVWFPKDAKLGKEITYKLHEKGDDFVAVKDSSRTKGEVMGSDCPQGKEDEPLYYKGQSTPRLKETTEFVGFAGEKLLSFEEKAKFLMSIGAEIRL
jgi:hypothetical protein